MRFVDDDDDDDARVTVCLSVCLSDRPSCSGIVSRRMKIVTIMRFPDSGRTISLVSEEV